MFRGTLLKNKPKKRSRKQNKNKNKKRKKQREEKNFQHIIQLILADTNVSIIDEVNVEVLLSLGANKIKWLTRMVNQGQVTEKAVVTIKDYVKGFVEGTDKAIDKERNDEIVNEDDSVDEIVDMERGDEIVDEERDDVMEYKS